MQRRILVGAAMFAGLTWLALGQSKKLSADDYAEIQQLYARYNTAIDNGDAEGWAATFTPDGTFQTFKGHDALVGFIKTWRERMNGASRRHWNTNLVITPTADGASGTVYLFLMDVSAKPPAILSASKYEDDLVRTSDGWRFKRRLVKADSAPAATKQ